MWTEATDDSQVRGLQAGIRCCLSCWGNREGSGRRTGSRESSEAGTSSSERGDTEQPVREARAVGDTAFLGEGSLLSDDSRGSRSQGERRKLAMGTEGMREGVLPSECQREGDLGRLLQHMPLQWC